VDSGLLQERGFSMRPRSRLLFCGGYCMRAVRSMVHRGTLYHHQDLKTLDATGLAHTVRLIGQVDSGVKDFRVLPSFLWPCDLSSSRENSNSSGRTGLRRKNSLSDAGSSGSLPCWTPSYHGFHPRLLIFFPYGLLGETPKPRRTRSQQTRHLSVTAGPPAALRGSIGLSA